MNVDQKRGISFTIGAAGAIVAAALMGDAVHWLAGSVLGVSSCLISWIITLKELPYEK